MRTIPNRAEWTDGVDARDQVDEAYYQPAPQHETHVESQPASHDLTLGMTALLGIFFAVALVCAVFFGFGYSTGRTLHSPNPPSAANLPPKRALPEPTSDTEPDASANSHAAPPLAAVQPAAKPNPGAALVTPVSGDPVAGDRAPGPPVEALPARRNSTPQLRTGSMPEPPSSPSATDPSATTNTQASFTGGAMVQIAAVAHPGDAEALARALRTNGFQAVVRTEPQDKLLHVQVGPFANRDQAKAMRARLEADGYNAFIKP